jgi:hypothetical protein
MAVTVARSNHSPGVAPQIGLSTDAQITSMTQALVRDPSTSHGWNTRLCGRSYHIV